MKKKDTVEWKIKTETWFVIRDVTSNFAKKRKFNKKFKSFLKMSKLRDVVSKLV